MWYLFTSLLFPSQRAQRLSVWLYGLYGILFVCWIGLHVRLAMATEQWHAVRAQQKVLPLRTSVSRTPSYRELARTCCQRAGVRCQYRTADRRLTMRGAYLRLAYALWLLHTNNISVRACTLEQKDAESVFRGVCA